MPGTPDTTSADVKPRSLLAFDFGTGQIGVAVGQTLTHSANPLTVLKARDGIPNWQQIEELLTEWQPDLLLVGLPLNMDGSESEFCQRTRKFARRLHGRFGKHVCMVDERLTTFAAKGQQRDQGKRSTSYRQQPVDHLAAVMIIETWYSDPSAAVAP